MKTLKTVLAALLAVAMVAGMAVAASADDFGDNFDTVTYDVKALDKAPVLDGVIDDGEYNKMEEFDDSCYTIANNGKTTDEGWAIEYDFYTGWTKDGLYVAVQMDAPNYVSLVKDNGMHKPWHFHCIGLGFATSDDDVDGNNPEEFWITRRSDLGESYVYAMLLDGFNGNSDQMNGPLEAIELAKKVGALAEISFENGKLTYETFTPWAVIMDGDADVASGDTFKMTLAVGVGDTNKCIKSLGGGTEPTPKGVQYLATVTLTGEPKVEVKEEPKEEVKEEVKEEPKTEVKEEVKEEPKPEVKEEPKKEEPKKEEPKKEEVKEEVKTEVKEEVKDNAETSDSFVLVASVVAVLALACAAAVVLKKRA